MKPIMLNDIIQETGALACHGRTFTTREKIIGIGSIAASADKQKTMPLPAIVGAVAIAGGIGRVNFW